MVVSGKKFQRQNSGSPKIKQKDIKERGESSKREVTKVKSLLLLLLFERDRKRDSKWWRGERASKVQKEKERQFQAGAMLDLRTLKS